MPLHRLLSLHRTSLPARRWRPRTRPRPTLPPLRRLRPLRPSMVCDFLFHLPLFFLLYLCSSCIMFCVYTVKLEHVFLFYIPDLVNLTRLSPKKSNNGIRARLEKKPDQEKENRKKNPRSKSFRIRENQTQIQRGERG